MYTDAFFLFPWFISTTLKMPFFLSFRFQSCAKHAIGYPCFKGLLEFSFCCWMAVRAFSFLWILYHNSTTSALKEGCKLLFDSEPQEWLLKFLYLIGCGAVLPLVLSSHCFEQSIHNVLCIVSQLVFMVSFNYGFNRWQPLMVYYGVTALLLNLQSVCVSLYNVYVTLQLARVDYGVTALYALQLYLLMWVSFYTSILIIKKIMKPNGDVLLDSGIQESKDVSQHVE